MTAFGLAISSESVEQWLQSPPAWVRSLATTFHPQIHYTQSFILPDLRPEI